MRIKVTNSYETSWTIRRTAIEKPLEEAVSHQRSIEAVMVDPMPISFLKIQTKTR